MWCHICDIFFAIPQDLIYHIERYHSRMSSSESEQSEHEIADVSERDSDDGNVASNTFEGESYDYKAEKKSDDSTAHMNTPPGLFHYDSDRSITTENISQEKCYDSDSSENNSYEKTAALYESPSKISDEDSKAHVSNILLGRRKQCNKKSSINASVSNETPKKQISSILKKRVRRRRKKVKKVAFCEKVLPKKKLSALRQEDIPEQSDNKESDQSARSFNEESNPQPVLNNNFVNPNNSVNSNPTCFIFTPNAGQDINNSATGSQPIQQSYLLIPLNAVAPNSTTPKPVNCFPFDSKNILKWLTKHKQLCKKIPYPLPQSFFNQIQSVHKAIFDRYCTASVSEESRAVLKVYEELDCMIHKHINSINNTLNIL